MTPEAQRIAIAEACGAYSKFCPDYPNDLNAMHEAAQRAEAFLRTLGLWREEPGI